RGIDLYAVQAQRANEHGVDLDLGIKLHVDVVRGQRAHADGAQQHRHLHDPSFGRVEVERATHLLGVIRHEPARNPHRDVGGGDAELPGQVVGAGEDDARLAPGLAEGGTFANDVAQPGTPARVQLRDPGGVGTGEVDDRLAEGVDIPQRGATGEFEQF